MPFLSFPFVQYDLAVQTSGNARDKGLVSHLPNALSTLSAIDSYVCSHITSHLNLPPFSVKLFSPVLSLSARIFSPS